jgi:hypothetical protein
MFLYYLISKRYPNSFNYPKENLTLFDSLYLSSVNHSTLGYGDITPKRKLAKTLVIIHILLVFFIAFLEIKNMISN